ncbi:hypothetical protein SteCoe_14932 [Stentor coeruleus]|uniref:B box-type domain-containing protein n=1 Tax=Stentor coeruleus TaxID=5963 RepID=A0A1R2C4V4_9CILI|nr:hypothetical protein SteCoe_14932 [Stentor coeruleus]
MAKRCLKPACDKEVAFLCECKGKPIFMCKKHPSEHLMSKGNHQIVGLLFKPEDSELNTIIDNFACVISKIRSIKTQTIDNTKIIVEKLLNESENLMKYLEDLEVRFSKLLKNIKSESECDFQDFECFKNVYDCDEKCVFEDLEALKKGLTEYYNIDPSLGSDIIIYSQGSSKNNTRILNLNSRISNPLLLKNENDTPSDLMINSGFIECKIDKFTKCIVNGANTYMIDIKSNKIKVLPNINYSYGFCGMICKDENAFLFGGSNNQASYKLNLNTLKWESISNPPSQYHYDVQGAASIIKNNIVLTSKSLDGLYHYNHVSNSYSKVFSLQMNQFNYVMQNWIVSSNECIYENVGNTLGDFKSYPNTLPISTLAVYCSFPARGHIYFINSSNELMRINCTLKKIEVISFKVNT